jgi:hypothetical protein
MTPKWLVNGMVYHIANHLEPTVNQEVHHNFPSSGKSNMAGWKILSQG